MTPNGAHRPCPPEEGPNQHHENAHLWLHSIDPSLTPEQRLQVNSAVDDALILLASIGYHVAYMKLQSECAEHDRSQRQEASRRQRLGWIRQDADMALQCYYDMTALCYDTPGQGGPAGAELAKELKKAARVLLSLGQQATQDAGEEIDLFTLRVNQVRNLPAGPPAP